MFRVIASLEVTSTSGGIRRRTVTLPDGEERTFTFSKEPQYFDVVPPEIAADPHLIVREVPDGTPLDGPLTSLKSERVEEPAAVGTEKESDGLDGADGSSATVAFSAKPKAGRKPKTARAGV